MFEMNDFMFDFFPIIFPVFFIIIFGIIIFTLIKNIITWNKNNHSPRLSVISRVVSKRSDVHNYRNSQDFNRHREFHSSTSTSYYVTFEVESGDRIEFSVSGQEYGMLAEGDMGILYFQGTRYIDFKRELD